MNVDINNRKLRLIDLVMHLDDDVLLEELERKANRIKAIASPKPDIANAVRPIRPNVSLEDIKREQNYKLISYDEFRKLADKLELKEPIEDLLAMLTK